MSSRHVPQPGDLLAARYRIVRSIDEGSVDSLLEAEDTLMYERVAIKLIHPEVGAESQVVERLLREAEAANRVRHPNVLEVYDVGQTDDWLFMVTELLDGEPLGAVFERGDIPPHELIGVLLGAMRGVAAAHRAGVIHRDIHPGNIFLAHEAPDAPVTAKVLDFGLAKVRNVQRSLTASGVTMGTLQYMSYEQLRNARDIDARTDIYSFGVVLYQGLTSKLPYDTALLSDFLLKLGSVAPTPPRRLNAGLPPALDRLVMWAIEREPDSRIPSMEAFIQELEPFASEQAFRALTTQTLPVMPARESAAAATALPSERPPEGSPAFTDEEPDLDVALATPRRPGRWLTWSALFLAGCAFVMFGARNQLRRGCVRVQEQARAPVIAPAAAAADAPAQAADGASPALRGAAAPASADSTPAPEPPAPLAAPFPVVAPEPVQLITAASEAPEPMRAKRAALERTDDDERRSGTRRPARQFRAGAVRRKDF